MRTSSAVMTHPRRLAQAEELASRLGVSVVVVDPDPGSYPSALRTAIRAWASVAPGATHHVVIQDDISADSDLLDLVAVAAERYPDAATAFYANWDSENGALVRLAALAGAAWVRAMPGEYTPCLAICLPVRLVEGLVDYARGSSGVQTDDAILSNYLRQVGCSCYISIPNAVEHIGDESIQGNDHHGLRRSACHVSHSDASAFLARGGVIEDVPLMPYIDHEGAWVRVNGYVSPEVPPLWMTWREGLRLMDLTEKDVLGGLSRYIVSEAVVTWSGVAAELGPDRMTELWAYSFLLGWRAVRLTGEQSVGAPAGPEADALRRRIHEEVTCTAVMASLRRAQRAGLPLTLRAFLASCAAHGVESGASFSRGTKAGLERQETRIDGPVRAFLPR